MPESKTRARTRITEYDPLVFRKEELSRGLPRLAANSWCEGRKPKPGSESARTRSSFGREAPVDVEPCPEDHDHQDARSSSVKRDANLTAAFSDWDFDSDSDTLDLAREAYQEGLDEAISEQVDTFVRNYLAT